MSHYVDVHVGRRIRASRFMAGLTQDQLGTAVGIKFQQIQKYEAGANRVSASRMHDIAVVLGVPVASFFEGLDAGGDAPVIEGADALAESVVSVDQFADKDAIEFVRCYYQLSEEPRRRLLDFTKSLAKAA